MAAQTSILHVRVDDQLKADAAEALAGVGLTISDAVRILLTSIAREGGLPAWLASDPAIYDEWFRTKVQEALNDTSPTMSHSSAMEKAQAVIDGKQPVQD